MGAVVGAQSAEWSLPTEVRSLNPVIGSISQLTYLPLTVKKTTKIKEKDML